MAWYHFIPGVGVAILAGETINKAAKSNQNTTTAILPKQETNIVPADIDNSPKDEGKKVEVKQESQGVNLTTFLLGTFGIISVFVLILVLGPNNKSKSPYTKK